MNDSNKKTKQSLRFNMLLIIILVALIPLLISMTLSYNIFQASMRDTIKESFEKSSTQLYNEINDFMSDTINLIRLISEDNEIKNVVEKGNQLSISQGYTDMTTEELEKMFNPIGNSMKIDENVVEIFNRTIEKFPYVKEIFITNKYGHNVEVSQKTSDFVQKGENWWENAYSSGEYIEDVEFDESANAMTFTISVTVYHPQTGKKNGVLKAAIDFSGIRNALNLLQVGETGESYLVNKNKIIITESRFKNDSNINNYLMDKIKNTTVLNLKVDTNGVNEAIKGNNGFDSYTNYKNKLVYGYFRPIEKYNWYLMIEQERSEVNKSITNFLFLMIISGIVLLILSIIIALIFSNRIVKPLKIITSKFVDLSKGMLVNENINIKSKNEIGLLASSFNILIDFFAERNMITKKIAEGDLTVNVRLASNEDEIGLVLSNMVDSLNDIISQINFAVELLSNGANQISDTTQELSNGTSIQASSIEEITASVTEITGQATQNVENSIKCDELASKSKDNSEKSNNQMKDLINAVNNINKSSNDINNIIKVIDDIAFQTNLLALNADIEAARVGKYGKGFAVVASSVRTLANKSSKAVKETSMKIIDALKNIDMVNKLVNITSGQLHENTSNIIKLRNLIKQVTQASQEQAKGIQQINTGLNQIEEIVQSNTANAEENAAASEELSSQAKKLKEMTAYFKIDTNKQLN